MGTRRVGIDIDVDVKGQNEVKALNKELKGIAGAGKTGATGLDAAAKSGSGLGNSVKGLVAGGLLAAAGAGLVSFGKNAITAASDVEEMQSKFNTVFKDLGGSVTAELETFADAANRSIYDLQGFAATLQDTFVPLGFARESASDMSIQLVKLAEDLASFNNLETSQVVEDLQSALVGNTETLRKYGVVATQAAIDQEALALGLEFTKGKMDAQTKAAAILSITMRSTTDAQGDAIKTADSYANQLKGLQAAQQELNVELGQVFLPMAGQVVSALAEFAKGGADGVRAMTDMTAAAEGVASQQLEAGKATQDWAEHGHRLTKTMSENTDLAFKLFGGSKFLREEFQKVAVAAGDYSGSNEDLAASLTNVFGEEVKVAGNRVILNGETLASVDALRNMNIEYQQSEALLAANSAGIASYDAKLIGLGSSITSATEATKNLIEADENGLDATQMYGEANATTAQQIAEAASAERNRAFATEASIAANSRLVGAFTNMTGPVDDMLQAQQDLSDASGEWVETTVSNAAQIERVNSQLAGDLSKEQVKAMGEILNTVDEGSAEWLATYNALQGDLTDSQRQGLIAQRSELEASTGQIASVYTGDSQAAEEAQQRIEEANQAMVESYKTLALEGSLALAALSPDPEALQRALDFAVSIGSMSQEAADLKLEAANTQIALEELNAKVVEGSISAEVAAGAFDLLTSGEARTAEQAVALTENVQNLHSELDGVSGTYEADIHVDTSAAEANVRRLRDLMQSIQSGSTNVNSAVGSQLAANAATGVPGLASGGSFTVPPGFPNDNYLVGLTSGEQVDVTPAGQTNNNIGGVTVNVYGGGDGVGEAAKSGTMDALRELGIKGF